jgi:hypothetical protein
VVDGLRHPEDHSFLVESFGPRFFHVHLDATIEQRSLRVELPPESLRKLSSHDVESNIDGLGSLADIRFSNMDSLAMLFAELDKYLADRIHPCL